MGGGNSGEKDSLGQAKSTKKQCPQSVQFHFYLIFLAFRGLDGKMYGDVRKKPQLQRTAKQDKPGYNRTISQPFKSMENAKLQNQVCNVTINSLNMLKQTGKILQSMLSFLITGTYQGW